MHTPLCWPLLAIIAAYILISSATTRFRRGLRNVPGPLLASVSSLDRVWSAATGLQMAYHIKLHEKYGKVVRLGPRHVSFSDTALIPQIYGTNSRFLKSNFYSLFDVNAASGRIPTIFSVRDENLHKSIKRPVASAYSLSTLRQLEVLNDDCSAIFMEKLEKLVDTEIDLGKWLHWYAFDVISSITFSNRLGFMDREGDIDNIIAAIKGRLVYNSVVGQAPWMHKFLFGNSGIAWLANCIPSVAVLNSSRHIVEFAAHQLQQSRDKEPDTGNVENMLARFKRFRSGEQVMSDNELLSHATSNIFAGSDTTAASLSAVFYYLCRNPHTYSRLLKEIDEADRRGELSDPISFTEAQTLEYLGAVIKEALRMHPAVGQLLERVVDEGGAMLGGTWLPGGTIVGLNPWVAARDEAVYGQDSCCFRPERWLEADGMALQSMERSSLAFGAGSRTCLGKHISYLEMVKLVPQVLRRYAFEFEDPKKEWTLHDYWFVQQTDLLLKITRRQ